MSCVDGTEFRQYFVVTNLSDGKIRGRYRFTKEDVERLGWDVPQVDRGVRTEAKMAWLRAQGADLVGARVYDFADRLPHEAWEDETKWWKKGYYAVWSDLPKRQGRPSTERDVDEMQRMELASEAFARGGMDAWNEFC
ncbi:hypothetical protein EBR25_13335 [bacterium]|nr:hypothetical protein [bacterium]